MRFIVIPARLASSRFYRKLVRTATGRSLISHTVSAALSAIAEKVIVAADSQEILDSIDDNERLVKVLTGHHDSGTMRVLDAVNKLNIPDDALIVNWQGDEPEFPADAANRLCDLAELAVDDIFTIATPISELGDPNHVKVVLSYALNAMYFSRAPIPFGAINGWKHIGIYAYSAKILRELQFAFDADVACENLEQLHWLSHGFKIAVLRVVGDDIQCGIDTEDQYREFVARKLRTPASG